jgi:formylglycine-generating enzyme required for sulfatase activity
VQLQDSFSPELVEGLLFCLLHYSLYTPLFAEGDLEKPMLREHSKKLKINYYFSPSFSMPTAIHKHKATNYFYDEILGGQTLKPPLRMMQIPTGEFLMGSPESEPERYAERESPQHLVSVPSFFMAKYPVTQAQWRLVAVMPQVKLELNSDPSKFKGDSRPVEQVSWDDAIEFCARLSKHTNRQYRLPTETEWEYACRAGTTTPFHFGNTISIELANFEMVYDETTPVDHFKIANTWGLCEMHGNVWEWCEDTWHYSYNKVPKDGSAWLIDRDDDTYIIRGGAWMNEPMACRSASRHEGFSTTRTSYLGFRLACSALGSF